MDKPGEFFVSYGQLDPFFDHAPGSIRNLFFSADMEAPDCALASLHRILTKKVPDEWYDQATTNGIDEFLRYVETCLTYVRFSVRDLNSLLKTNVVVLNDLQVLFKTGLNVLKSCSSQAGTRVCRINELLKTIRAAFDEARVVEEAMLKMQNLQTAKSPPMLSSDKWVPFIQSSLEATSAERDFLISLWKIYASSDLFPPRHILLHLCQLFQKSPPQKMLCSDSSVDTTYLCVTHLIRELMRRPEMYDPRAEKPNLPLVMISLSHVIEELHWTQTNDALLAFDENYSTHCFERHKCFSSTMCKLWFLVVGSTIPSIVGEAEPEFIFESKPASKNIGSSVLWRKLYQAQTTDAILQKCGFNTCYVCCNELATDFAILDNCSHLFCIPCIAGLYGSKRCPYCLACAFTWTTASYFAIFMATQLKLHDSPKGLPSLSPELTLSPTLQKSPEEIASPDFPGTPILKKVSDVYFY